MMDLVVVVMTMVVAITRVLGDYSDIKVTTMIMVVVVGTTTTTTMMMMMIAMVMMTMAISRVFGDYSDMKVTMMMVVVVVVMTVDTVVAFIAVVVANAVHGVPLKEWRSTGWAATFTGPILCTTLLRWRDWTDPTGRC